ncbi:MAG: GHKL domain-containing protein [Ruminococcus sp.]|nr:GHKL domain-containing protein [Ruminococcus sp.]
MISIFTAIAYIVKDISAVICLLMIMHFIFLNKPQIKKSKVLLIAAAIMINAFFGALYLVDHTEDYKAVMDFASNIIYIIALQLLTESKKLSKNIWLVFICIFTIDMFYSFIVPYVGDILCIECLFNVAIFTFICIFIKYTTQKSQVNFLPKIFEEIPNRVYVTILLFELTCYYKEFGISSAWYNALYVFSSIAVVMCVLYLIFKIFYMAHQQNNILAQMEIQKNFGEKIAINDEELRRFRHDYKNHMIVVNAYLESGRVNEAREYLDSINNSINGVMNNIRTGNFIADAILNNKSVLAAKNDTHITFRGLVPADGIENEDLCTILANLVDNAIEACEKVTGEKKIEIESTIVNGFLILSVSNSTVSDENPKLKTTKKDKRNHGIGLKNVERAVKKYGGAMSMSCENNIFTADIRIKIIKNHNAKVSSGIIKN